ncbi:MAG: 3-hydroxyacyl-ACP dehydratase FabZ [Verrucomicrobia bacterium]|jgi:3-hydroxyacyl-[acyl-carrier-protein] dehydratase|nr:3-hydroxyacyl-ACP dehydratase FabZ [Verrucomicrobiota bacterium]
MTSEAQFELDEILEHLPHRPPFLFVDRVLSVEPFKRIVAERTLRSDEPHFEGHFPGRPIMPGVLITDALAQVSGLLIGLSAKLTESEAPGSLFFLGAANVKYPGTALPGDTLTMRAYSDGSVGRLYRFTVEASVGRKTVAKGSLTLAMAEDAS